MTKPFAIVFVTVLGCWGSHCLSGLFCCFGGYFSVLGEYVFFALTKLFSWVPIMGVVCEWGEQV